MSTSAPAGLGSGHAAVEVDIMRRAPLDLADLLRLGRDLDGRRGAMVEFEQFRLAVDRSDREFVSGRWLSRVVAPLERLHRMFRG